jgi:hypothetical protein
MENMLVLSVATYSASLQYAAQFTATLPQHKNCDDKQQHQSLLAKDIIFARTTNKQKSGPQLLNQKKYVRLLCEFYAACGKLESNMILTNDCQ